MNRLLCYLCALAWPVWAQGQSSPDSTITLDILVAPASPGASLLGVAPSEILKPVEPKAFAASIQNATNNLSSLPKSFAVDVAPAWFFGGKRIDYERFSNNKNIADNVWQSLVVSTAFKNDTVQGVRTPQWAVGLKFSILRGHLGKKTKQLLDSSTHELGRLATFFQQQPTLLPELRVEVDSLKAQMGRIARLRGVTDPEFLDLKERAELLADQLEGANRAALTDEKLSRLKQIARTIKYTRYGLKLDAAAGWVYSFPGESFRAGSATKFGAWLTPGWEFEKTPLSLLGILRYLENPDNPLADAEGVLKGKRVNTLDYGARLIYGSAEQRVALSAEAIYRSIASQQDIPNPVQPSWRVVVNAEYELNSDTRLTLTLGKNFDNTTFRQGNVIGFLNLIGAFGGETRTLKSK